MYSSETLPETDETSNRTRSFHGFIRHCTGPAGVQSCQLLSSALFFPLCQRLLAVSGRSGAIRHWVLPKNLRFSVFVRCTRNAISSQNLRLWCQRTLNDFHNRMWLMHHSLATCVFLCATIKSNHLPRPKHSGTVTLFHNANETNRHIHFTLPGYKETSVSLCVMSFLNPNSRILSSRHPWRQQCYETQFLSTFYVVAVVFLSWSTSWYICNLACV